MPHTLKSNNHKSFETGITASTTQTQGNGPLTASINEISTVANTGDTVTLPSVTEGFELYIINNGANTLQIFPASGDDLGSGLNTAINLESGAERNFFGIDDSIWTGQILGVGCKLTKSSDQNINDSTTTILTWDQEVYDDGNLHDNSTNNSRITIVVDGKYIASIQTAWEAGSTGRRDIQIQLNGTTIIARDRVPGDSFSYQSCSWPFKLIKGDYIEALVRQTNGTSLDFKEGNSGLDKTFFAIQKII